MLRFATILCICLSTTGCLYLPAPHKEWVAPPASGRVIDGSSGAVVTNAIVTRFEPAQVSANTRTDPGGQFAFDGVLETRWFHLDRPASAAYKVKAPGYQVFETRKGGWAFRKDLRHDLGEIKLESK